jgi:hypothetical protein
VPVIEQRTCQKFLGKESGISGFAPVVKRNNCPVDLEDLQRFDARSTFRAQSEVGRAGYRSWGHETIAAGVPVWTRVCPQAQEQDAVNRALMLTATVTAVFVLYYALLPLWYVPAAQDRN